ncbi:hypothetical protein BZG36_02325 [Bifiguratus adelaidae]|uniref:GYF domain-containing protein n=1 Tax=Bifiguratus adelaidae TaxID=1938954 RepID=A0A261Y2W2_9FUNG|nr:hypothetical protein BZG36_02325 [Bifiguratus adelaidae]
MTTNTMNFGPEWMRGFPKRSNTGDSAVRSASPQSATIPQRSASSTTSSKQSAPQLFSYSSVAATNLPSNQPYHHNVTRQQSISEGYTVLDHTSVMTPGGSITSSNGHFLGGHDTFSNSYLSQHGSTLHNGGDHGLTTSSADNLNPFKYSKEIMLSLFKPSTLPAEFEQHEYVTVLEAMEPLAFVPMSDAEKKLSSSSINSETRRVPINQEGVTRGERGAEHRHRGSKVAKSGDEAANQQNASGVKDSRSSHDRHRDDSQLGKRQVRYDRNQSSNPGAKGDTWNGTARDSLGSFDANGFFRVDDDNLLGGALEGAGDQADLNTEEDVLESTPAKPDTFDEHESAVHEGGHHLHDGSDDDVVKEVFSLPLHTTTSQHSDEHHLFDKRTLDQPSYPAFNLSDQGSLLSPSKSHHDDPLLGSSSVFRSPPHSRLPSVDGVRWLYRDPSGNVQGPFTTSNMEEWFKAGFFSPTLLVIPEEGSQFEPLGKLIQRVRNDQQPFLATATVLLSSPGLARLRDDVSNAGPGSARFNHGVGRTAVDTFGNVPARMTPGDATETSLGLRDASFGGGGFNLFGSSQNTPAFMKSQNGSQHSPSLMNSPFVDRFGTGLFGTPVRETPSALGGSPWGEASPVANKPSPWGTATGDLFSGGMSGGMSPLLNQSISTPGFLSSLGGNVQPTPQLFDQQQRYLQEQMERQKLLQQRQQAHLQAQQNDVLNAVRMRQQEELHQDMLGYHQVPENVSQRQAVQGDLQLNSHWSNQLFTERSAAGDTQKQTWLTAGNAQEESAPEPSGSLNAHITREDKVAGAEHAEEIEKNNVASQMEQMNLEAKDDVVTYKGEEASSEHKAEPVGSAWARQEAAPRAPSLREIQETEATLAAQREKEKIARLAQIQQQVGSDDAGLTNLSWGVYSPGSKPLAGGEEPSSTTAVWANTSAPKKTLREIQQEEEEAMKKARAKAAAQQTASVNAGAGFGEAAAMPTGSGKRFADLLAGGSKPQQIVGSAWSGASAVRSPSRIIPPAVATPPPPKPLNDGWQTVAGSGKATSAKPTPVATKPSAPVSETRTNNAPSDAFLNWCRLSLKGLASGVNGKYGNVLHQDPLTDNSKPPVEEFIQMLLAFPADGSSGTVEIIQDMVYANSTSLDGRRFADEFIKKRKLDMAGKPIGNAVDFNKVNPAKESATFQVVTKKGKKKAGN